MAQWVESTCSAGVKGDSGSIPNSERSPEGNGNSSILARKKSHEQRTLVSYSLWDYKELDVTERLTTRTDILILHMENGVSKRGSIAFTPTPAKNKSIEKTSDHTINRMSQ